MTLRIMVNISILLINIEPSLAKRIREETVSMQTTMMPSTGNGSAIENSEGPFSNLKCERSDAMPLSSSIFITPKKISRLERCLSET